MRVLSNIYPFHVATGNRDLAVHRDVAWLSRQYPDLEISFVDSPLAVAVGNVQLGLARLLPKLMRGSAECRLPSPLHYAWHGNWVPRRLLARRRIDLLFCHEYFPLNLSDEILPIVYGTRLPPPHCAQAYGLADADVAKHTALKRNFARRSTLVVVSSPGDAERFAAEVPDVARKVRVAPMYLPELEPEPETVLQKHAAIDKLKLLFVGADARRKGLPNLLRALGALQPRLRERIILTVVSSFRDGAIDERVPRLELRLAGRLPRDKVQELMLSSHALVLPTFGDTFGLVLVEAMAAGCLVISSAREPQNWILDYGQAGIVVEPEAPASITDAVVRALCSCSERASLAAKGLARFKDTFYHYVVGAQLRSFFDEAAHLWRQSKQDKPKS
jgi:glycosyltransferase involved in cell wall biosynthesis